MKVLKFKIVNEYYKSFKATNPSIAYFKIPTLFYRVYLIIIIKSYPFLKYLMYG